EAREEPPRSPKPANGDRRSVGRSARQAKAAEAQAAALLSCRRPPPYFTRMYAKSAAVGIHHFTDQLGEAGPRLPAQSGTGLGRVPLQDVDFGGPVQG